MVAPQRPDLVDQLTNDPGAPRLLATEAIGVERLR